MSGEFDHLFKPADPADVTIDGLKLALEFARTIASDDVNGDTRAMAGVFMMMSKDHASGDGLRGFVDSLVSAAERAPCAHIRDSMLGTVTLAQIGAWYVAQLIDTTIKARK